MTEKKQIAMARVRHQFASLKSLGVAVQYFPMYRNQSVGLHAVDVVLFSVALRGRARHFIDQDEFDMKPGSVGITSYGQKHDVVTTARGIEKFNLYLDLSSHPLPHLPAPLGGLLATMVRTPRSLGHRLNRGFQFRVDDVARLRQTLQRMDTEIHDRRPGYAEIVRARLTEFLIDCCRGAHDSGLVRSEPQNELFPAWVRTLRSQLDAEFREPLTLADLADANGVSVGHLCRTFRAYTGKAIVDYVIDRRIQAAMLALETGSDKTLKIALDHGFTDYSYFHRQFRRRTGQSPSQFRRKRRPA